MHVRLGSALIFLAVAFSAAPASAQVDWATCGYDATGFPACSSTRTTCCRATASTDLGVGAATNRPVIIPMDRCHQQLADNDYPGSGAPDNSGNGWCVNPSGTSANGMFKAYGLIYRLMQRGIPVFWLVNPTKSATGVAAFETNNNQRYTDKDIDVWVLSPAATIKTAGALTALGAVVPPVRRLLTSNATLSAYDGSWSYTVQEFPIRGSAFLIAGTDTDGDGTNDRAELNTFWDTYGDGSPGAGRSCGASDCYDFRDVRLYEINQNATLAWRDHITGTNITDSAPVAVKITYQPPRIARVDPGGAVSTLWLGAANLDDPATSACKTGPFSPSDAVWCELTEADVENNRLVSGGFGWAWLDGGNGFGSCSAVLTKMRAFLSGVPGLWGAGNVMANDTHLDDIEKCANYQLLGQQGPITGSLATGNVVNETASRPLLVRYPTNLFAQYGDMEMDFATSSVAHWSTNATRRYNSLISGAGGSLKRLISREAASSDNAVCGDLNADGDVSDAGERAHSQDLWPNANAAACDGATTGGGGDAEDLLAYARHDNTALNGIVFYTGGNQLANKASHLRMVLNSIIATPSGAVTVTPTSYAEVSRATPVTPTIDAGAGAVDAIVQGTGVYESPVSSPTTVQSDADITNFRFPYRKGHVRARALSDSSVLFNAGCNASVGAPYNAAPFTGMYTCPAGTGGIPTNIASTCTFPKDSSNASCRMIFTTTQRGDLRAQAIGSAAIPYLNTTTVAQKTLIQGLMSQGANLTGTTIDTLISRVYAGHWNGAAWVPLLGAVNRSTVAVIQASQVAGSPARPKIAYFGAEDGMLHAVCAEVNAARGCDVLGRELWAFMPRTMLPFVRLNQARIDGSPRVIDAYIDTDGGAYNPAWKTVLTFQTGMGDATHTGRVPAVYALDVTDPSNPRVMWEHSMDVTARGAYELGVGLGLAAGPASISGLTKYVAWAQTTSLGTDANVASLVTAINLEDGSEIWQQAYEYPDPPRAVSANDSVVESAIPGGVVPIDLTDAGRVTDLTWADLYGNLWFADPATGASRNGAGSPLFRVSANYRAMGARPAIFESGGAQYAVFTTGGYHDPSNTTWPMECCKADASGSCLAAGSQPNPPEVCAQYNNSTTPMPRQYAIAVKLDSTVTSPLAEQATECDNSPATAAISACSDTRFLFRRNLGWNERGYTAPLVVGQQIFFTVDTQNINRATYTGGAGVGALYTLDSNGGSSVGPTLITTGATGLATGNELTGVRTIVGSTNSGTFFTTSSDGSTGTRVDSRGTSSMQRRLWLRVE